MSEALYRKYRPQKWGEVAGQEHIVSVLEAAVKNGHATHAYLFSGSRGTGKTSVARILAKSLGCAPEDLVEIDAASNTGINDIRELQEGVRTMPFKSPVKVYIIDEVHMLSKSAFNALLKTLEEPPAHVVFILATTDAHKVPETVLSRCEVHNFKKPSLATLVKTVNAIAKKEGCVLPPESAQLLAFLGDGSFRDTIGLLQKVINTSDDKNITAEEVLAITGAPEVKLVRELATAVVLKDLAAALAAVQMAERSDLELKVLVKLLLRAVRLIMLAAYAPKLKDELKAETGSEEWEFIEEMAAKPEVKDLPAALRELISAFEDMGRTAVPALPLELALVKILTG